MNRKAVELVDDIPNPRHHLDGVTYHPDWTTHPGEHWRGLLEDRMVAQATLAREVGASAKHINQIMQGHALPSAALVIKMAEVLDAPAKLMWQLQSNFLFEEAWHARKERRM